MVWTRPTPDVASAHGHWILRQLSAAGCPPAHDVERGMECRRARLAIQDMAEGQASADGGVGAHLARMRSACSTAPPSP